METSTSNNGVTICSDTRVPKLRTLRVAVENIREIDPKSCVNECMMRRAIQERKLPAKRVGNRFIVDLDDVLTFMQTRE